VAPLKTRTWAPTEGDVVTFTHSGFLWATKKPKLPSLQHRADIEWNDVLLNWKEPIPSSRRTHSPPPHTSLLHFAHTSNLGFLAVPRKEYLPKGYWQDINNRKRFFCEFAEEMGFDPYNPDNWKNVTLNQLKAVKKVNSLSLFSLSLSLSLLSLSLFSLSLSLLSLSLCSLSLSLSLSYFLLTFSFS